MLWAGQENDVEEMDLSGSQQKRRRTVQGLGLLARGSLVYRHRFFFLCHAVRMISARMINYGIPRRAVL